MRAERLLSLVLLLRARRRSTAPALAAELGVSVRTVLRDVDALSLAGVPVYAERGRAGGFALLPGFRADLADLTDAEIVALLAASTTGTASALGLRPAAASALRKLVGALPETSREAAERAAERILVDPGLDLLERATGGPPIDSDIAGSVREAVLEGRRLRLRYAGPGRDPSWRTVDPVGLVSVRGTAYLLGTVGGEDRTFRMSRIVATEVQDAPAERADAVDLPALWRSRAFGFRRGGDVVTVTLRVHAEHQDALRETALTVEGDSDSGTVTAVFQDERHAVWALWTLADAVEVLAPLRLRTALLERAQRIVARYSDRASPATIASTPSG